MTRPFDGRAASVGNGVNAFLVTQGAPGNETRTAIMYIANEGLAGFRMGNAAAMSYVLAVVLAVIAVLNFRLLRPRD